VVNIAAEESSISDIIEYKVLTEKIFSELRNNKK